MITQETGTFHPEAPKRTLESFDELNLSQPILRAIHAEGYTTPTPIQALAIPSALEGADLLGCAQTGTGKTAAFALPILHRLSQTEPAYRRKIRALVLAPTRELAIQIHDSFRVYGRFTSLRGAAIFGGVNQNPQTRALQRGIDILVATPGRLLDLMNQGYIDLRHLETFVLDEADRMFDMGFVVDVRRIVAAIPPKRQTLFFSATMPEAIRALAETLLTDPVKVQVTPQATQAEKIEQSLYFIDKASKPDLLCKILSESAVTRAIVFTRTKHGADRLTLHLEKAGIRADAIHGNKTQNARQRALENFRSMATPVLVATDIAARGLDIDAVSHVFNYDLPEEPETYIHRIGRTARAGASGIAISFCDATERSHLFAIERLLRAPITLAQGAARQPWGNRPRPSAPPMPPRRPRPPMHARTPRSHR